uniref:Uncharacterized protein n=1 Tax=Panagrolaimus sp. PS1159 TaxID=55785 RepID=A0AC35GH28_9BILA
MPPPNVFKAYKEATGKGYKKVEISISPEKCESAENDVVEIDTTKNGKEKVKSNDTVTESEMEIKNPASENKNKGGRPKRKTKGGGRPKTEKEQSKWPAFTKKTARCYLDGVGHKGGCA